MRATTSLIRALIIAVGVVAWAHTAGADGQPFTIAKYPVDAEAENAAKAQKKALADGRRAALQSLLKRLVPISAYTRLSKLKALNAQRLVSGVSVRSAQNSSTQYIATLDFAFDPDGIRKLLRNQAIPFVETQAQATILVPVVVRLGASKGDTPAAAALSIQTAGRTATWWRRVWRNLDLENTLTPLKVAKLKPGIDSAMLSAARAGRVDMVEQLAAKYRLPRVLLAIAQTDSAGERLYLTMAGQDAVGAFSLNRSYTYQRDDLEYTMELAAVIALGTLEGRWKAVQTRGTGSDLAARALLPVQIFVQFRSMRQWLLLKRQLKTMPGVSDFQEGGVSRSGANIALRFPGGGARLAGALAERGIIMQRSGGTWIARSSQR